MRVPLPNARASVSTGVLLAALVVPSAAPAGVSEPDGEVKKKGGSFIGLGVINTSGDGQTARLAKRQGETAVFKFRYHNTNVGTDDFFIGGCVREAPLRVRYFTGGNDVTTQVNNGTLEFENIAADEVTPTVRAEVKVRRRADDGFVEEVCVPVVAQNQMVRDEPGWRVKVK